MNRFNPHYRIEIRHEPIEKQLTREVFEFWLDVQTMRIFLDRYYRQKRETTRHGWKSFEIYDRTDRRRSNSTAPVLNDTLISMVVSHFINDIRSFIHITKQD